VVVTVTFAEGHRIAQATTALQGYNGFILRGHVLRGRMEGNGGSRDRDGELIRERP